MINYWRERWKLLATVLKIFDNINKKSVILNCKIEAKRNDKNGMLPQH